MKKSQWYSTHRIVLIFVAVILVAAGMIWSFLLSDRSSPSRSTLHQSDLKLQAGLSANLIGGDGDDLLFTRHQDLQNSWNPIYRQYKSWLTDGSQYPSVLYNLQISTSYLFDFAMKTGDLATLDQIAELYLMAADPSHLRWHNKQWVYTGSEEETENRCEWNEESQQWGGEIALERDGGYVLCADYIGGQMWVDANGREQQLYSSQFLFAVAHAVNAFLDVPSGMRTENMQQMIDAYMRVLDIHYYRWIFGEQGVFQVRGWRCAPGLYNHNRYMELVYNEQLNQWNNYSYCNAITDADLWIFAGAVEYMASRQKDRDNVPPSFINSNEWRSYAQLMMDLLEKHSVENTVYDHSAQPVASYVLSPGSFRDHHGHRYAGYDGDIFPEDNSQFPLNNGHFEQFSEDGSPQYWEASPDLVLSKDLQHQWDGQSSVRLSAGESGEGFLSQEREVEGGHRFNMSAFVKMDSSTSAEVRIEWKDSEGSVIESAALVRALTSSSDWQEVVIDGEIPANATRVNVLLSLSGDGSVWLDAARFFAPLDQSSSAPLQIIPPAVLNDVSWDISHAARLVLVLESIVKNAHIVEHSFASDETIKRYARQFAYGVFNGDFDRPLFSNYFDGSNGWYRVNYSDRLGFAYAPSHFSRIGASGGYCRWGEYVPEIKTICDALWRMVESTDRQTVAHREQYYDTCRMGEFEQKSCDTFRSRTSESYLNFIASYHFATPVLSENPRLYVESDLLSPHQPFTVLYSGFTRWRDVEMIIVSDHDDAIIDSTPHYFDTESVWDDAGSLTHSLASGDYTLRAYTSGRQELIAELPLSVLGFSIDENTYRAGDDVPIAYSGFPAGGSDWVGLYEVGAGDREFIKWIYTHGNTRIQPEGDVSGMVTFTLPSDLEPGEYELRAYRDNSYIRLLEGAITVE